MEINNINNNSFGPGTSASPVEAGSEKDLFMTLLVAQLKNQDPLSPQDGTEFVAQLAQFNSLDQLIGIRDAIERLTIMAEQPIDTSTTSSQSLSSIK
ncbi:MAG: hypothetical protein HKN33_01080 [Pyrinomonadaceae bacterium]|nr:hypothetical protein [Pyrinomonadaceae bacterium]